MPGPQSQLGGWWEAGENQMEKLPELGLNSGISGPEQRTQPLHHILISTYLMWDLVAHEISHEFRHVEAQELTMVS